MGATQTLTKYAAITVITLLFAHSASALRCGTKLVAKGDFPAKVEKICGKPDSVQFRTIYRSGIPRQRQMERRRSSGVTEFQNTREELLLHNRSVVEVVVEEWIYNFGPNRFMTLIRFENGLVTELEQLGYGYVD